MEHTPENLDHFSEENQKIDMKQEYKPRPIGHLILAWALIAVVLFAFLGTCYWMINYGRA